MTPNIQAVIVVFMTFTSCVHAVYVKPTTTGYKPPTATAYDYCWQLYQDVFNGRIVLYLLRIIVGTNPYNKYMGPWVLMSDFIYVMMEADILGIDTIVSL